MLMFKLRRYINIGDETTCSRCMLILVSEKLKGKEIKQVCSEDSIDSEAIHLMELSHTTLPWSVLSYDKYSSVTRQLCVLI